MLKNTYLKRLSKAEIFLERDHTFALFLILSFLRCPTLEFELRDVQAINMPLLIEYFFL